MFGDDGFIYLAVTVDVYEGINRFWWETVADDDEVFATYDEIIRTLLLNFDEEKLKQNGRWKHKLNYLKE